MESSVWLSFLRSWLSEAPRKFFPCNDNTGKEGVGLPPLKLPGHGRPASGLYTSKWVLWDEEVDVFIILVCTLCDIPLSSKLPGRESLFSINFWATDSCKL